MATIRIHEQRGAAEEDETMIEYTVQGAAMTLSVETSRECGHLAGIDGEGTPDGRASDAVRREVRRDAQLLADRLGCAVEVYAQHPSAQDWQVDSIEPSH